MRRNEKSARFGVEDLDDVCTCCRNNVMCGGKPLLGDRKREWYVNDHVSRFGLADCRSHSWE